MNKLNVKTDPHVTERGAERLLRGADLMETVSRRLFNRFHWYRASVNHVGRDLRRPVMHDSPIVDCRSTACALGHMASDPWFRRRGLRLNINPEMLSFAKETRDSVYAEVWYRDFPGLYAASEFFDISMDHSRGLFGRHGPTTPKQVAVSLRRFVRSGVVIIGTHNEARWIGASSSPMGPWVSAILSRPRICPSWPARSSSLP